ncbi:MAG: hypothetical protein JO013_14755 [Alphaproteobacteria bacterium]|nr:hypothetical protein [Alphaproteobacteria bacterium]
MFKKGELRITTAVSAALLAAGCGPKFDAKNGWNAAENTAVCTDEKGNRVEDRNCDRNYRAVGGYHHYGWYYIPRGTFVPPIGGLARGGGYVAPAGSHYTPAGVSASHIARGGFGSSGHFAAGRGG